MPPESKSTVKEIQRKFGEVEVDVDRYKRQGEVVLVICFNSRIGKDRNDEYTLRWLTDDGLRG